MTLPDDVAIDILARLNGDDVATLFRCTTACKGWHRLVAEPSFLLCRRRCPSSLVGFVEKPVLAEESPGATTMDDNSQLAFVPLLSGPSPFGTRRRTLSSLANAEDAVPNVAINRSMLLETRGGFLVVRLFPNDLDMVSNIVCLAVCNLLAGTWDVLPELDCNTQFSYSNDSYSCDMLPSSDGVAFKVLMIGRDREKSQYNLHTFASGEARWRAPISIVLDDQIWSVEQRTAVLCQGYAHWLFVSPSNYFHVLSYNVETKHVSLMKLLSPTKVSSPIMGEDDQRVFLGIHLTTTAGGGAILALRRYSGGKIEIWTHDQNNGYGDAKW
ncbi:unnamed protein product [Alopecurus aequalis]